VPVCAGKTVAVQLTTAPGGQPSTVWFDADTPATLSGHTNGTVPPGTTGAVYATAPAGTTNMTVTLGPGLGGGHIKRVRIGLLGSCAR
jgi:hypothetical protein